MKTIVLTGGGTAGHVIPNVALLPYLRRRFDRIVYFGGNGIEKRIAERNGLPYYQTTVVKLERGKILSNLKIPFALAKGVAEATRAFRDISPDVVFSKGGYAALPACYAAKRLDVPVVCHESDYSMGVANRLVSGFAKSVLTSFPETKGGVYVGNPVRREILKKDLLVAETFPSFDPDKKTVLVCGGSLGAVPLNTALYEALPDLVKTYNVLHVAGKNGDFSVRCKGYYQCSYTDEFPAFLRASDVVVCRSGANTLSEVAALGKRCVTIPLPKGVSRGDQLLNAESYEKRGFCSILPQENLSADTLLSAIEAVRYLTPPKLDVSAVGNRILSEIEKAMS